MKVTIWDIITITLFLCGAALPLLGLYQLNEVKFQLHLIIFIFICGFIYPFIISMMQRILVRIMPLKAGIYSLESREFFIWKLLLVTTESSRLLLNLFIPIFLRSLLYKISGAKIGKHAVVSGRIIDGLLTQVDEGAVIGEGALVTGHLLSRGQFFVGPNHIGKNATIGVGSVIMPGAIVGENSVVLPLSVVGYNAKIPPNEIWGGCPARKIEKNQNL